MRTLLCVMLLSLTSLTFAGENSWDERNGNEPNWGAWNSSGKSWGGKDWNRERYNETREFTLPLRNLVEVEAGQNGGVSVKGWEEDTILVKAKINVFSDDRNDARDLAEQISIDTGDVITSDGPKPGSKQSWSVSFEIYVPMETDLDLKAYNGGISIQNVNGLLRFKTTNGGVSLKNLSGDVQGRTTNGGLNIELAGSEWEGVGLDVVTSNGGVNLKVPSGYNADLEAGTTNGGMTTDFPIMVKGKVSKQLKTSLGDGGPPIRVRTTNGGFRLKEI